MSRKEDRKLKLWKRDEGKCGIHSGGCRERIVDPKSKDVAVDEIIPRSYLKIHLWISDPFGDWNSQIMHKKCNDKKGGQFPQFPNYYQCKCHFWQILPNGDLGTCYFDPSKKLLTWHLFAKDIISSHEKGWVKGVKRKEGSGGFRFPGIKSPQDKGLGHYRFAVSQSRAMFENLYELYRVRRLSQVIFGPKGSDFNYNSSLVQVKVPFGGNENWLMEIPFDWWIGFAELLESSPRRISEIAQRVRSESIASRVVSMEVEIEEGADKAKMTIGLLIPERSPLNGP